MQEIEERVQSLEEWLEGTLKAISKIKETLDIVSEQQKETEKTLDRLSRQHEETEKTLDRLSRQHEETEKTLDRLSKEHEKTEKGIQELKEQNAKIAKRADQERKEMNRRWGEIANSLGILVEGIVFPSARPVLEKYFKCNLDYLAANIIMHNKSKNLKGEFDIVGISKECKNVFLIEVKTKPSKDNIKHFAKEVIPRFKDLFEEYRDYKLIPIFATLTMNKKAIDELTQNHIYAMVYKEYEYMDIINFGDLAET